MNFICPSCKHQGIEEVLSGDLDVITWITSIDEEGNIEYGQVCNEGGYVVRYQCRGCGYVIVDDCTCGDDALDGQALVKALNELNSPKKDEVDEVGEVVDFSELIQSIAEAYEHLEGEALTEIWNNIFPTRPIVYDGDSLFHWKSGEGAG